MQDLSSHRVQKLPNENKTAQDTFKKFAKVRAASSEPKYYFIQISLWIFVVLVKICVGIAPRHLQTDQKPKELQNTQSVENKEYFCFFGSIEAFRKVAGRNRGMLV